MPEQDFVNEYMPGFRKALPSAQDIERLYRIIPQGVHPLYKPRGVMENAEQVQVIYGQTFQPLAFAMAAQGFVSEPFDVNATTWQATIPLFPHGNAGAVGQHRFAVVNMTVRMNLSLIVNYTGGPFVGNLYDLTFSPVLDAWALDIQRAAADLNRRVDAVVREQGR